MPLDRVESFSVARRLGAESQCPVCLSNEPQDPRSLPCIHFFCLPCLEKLHKIDTHRGLYSNNQIQCPTCRELHFIPKGGVQQLPKDHRTLSLIGLRKKYEEMMQERFLYCMDCPSRQAGQYCMECEKAMCEACSDRHNTKSKFEAHLTIVINEHTKDLLCKIHGHQYVTNFCTDCSTAVCNLCISEDHCKHELTDFTTEDKPDTPPDEITWSYLERRRDQLNTLRDSLLKSKQSNDQICEKTKKNVKDYTENLIKSLREQEQELYISSDTYHGHIKDQIAKLQPLVNRAIKINGDILEMRKIWKNPIPSQPHITQTATLPVEYIQQAYCSIPGPLPSTDQWNIDWKFVSEGHNKILGKIITQTKSLVPGNISNIDEADINSGIKIKWKIKKSGNLVDVCCENQGDGVICNIRLSDTEYRLEKVINGNSTALSEHMYIPDVYKDCAIFINHFTKIFGVRSDNKITLYKAGEKISSFSGQKGTLVSSTLDNAGNVYVITRAGTIMGDICSFLSCYDKDGDEQWSQDITKHGLPTDGPITMKIDLLQRIIITDPTHARLHIYSRVGDQLLAAVIPGESMAGTCSLCVDGRNNLIVGLAGSDTVTLFSSNGHFIRHLVKMENKPTCICLVGETGLVVGSDTGEITMFEIR